VPVADQTHEPLHPDPSLIGVELRQLRVEIRHSFLECRLRSEMKCVGVPLRQFGSEEVEVVSPLIGCEVKVLGLRRP
jgi:hypothetical protein